MLVHCHPHRCRLRTRPPRPKQLAQAEPALETSMMGVADLLRFGSKLDKRETAPSPTNTQPPQDLISMGGKVKSAPIGCLANGTTSLETGISSLNIWTRPHPVWGCPLGSRRVRQKAMIDYRYYAWRPDEDEAPAGGFGIHVYSDERSAPSREVGR